MSLEEDVFKVLGYAGVQPINAGAVSDVFRAELDGRPIIIKVLSHEHTTDATKAEGVRNEARVLKRLNAAEVSGYPTHGNARERLDWALETASQRAIVALLDDGEDPVRGPWVVQELAPDEFQPPPATDLRSELSILRVMRRVAGAMALAHKHDFALRDFEPHTKGDRIRVRWHDGLDEPEVKVIDWNVTGGLELFAQDIFFFGLHLYRFLLGEHLQLDGDKKPPHTLGLGVQGWKLVSEGARLILGKLLHRDPEQLYRSAQQLEEDLAWHIRSVEIALQPSQIDKLKERATLALTQGRYDRLLAVTALGLGPGAPPELRQALEPLNETARSELEKKLRVALAMIQVSMNARQYRQAIDEARQQFEILEAHSEAARRVRYLELQARVGLAFRTTGLSDVNETSAWGAIERGMKHLGRSWEEASREFQQAEALAPRLQGLKDFVALRDLPEAWLSFERAAALHARAQPRPGAERAEDWGAREGERLDWLAQAVAALEKAVGSVRPERPELIFNETLGRYRDELKKRQDEWKQLTEAEDALKEGDDQKALDSILAVLYVNPANGRAEFLRPKAERKKRFTAAVQAGRDAIAVGDYAAAVEILAATDVPDLDNPGAADLRAIAKAGAAVTARLNDLLEEASAARGSDLLGAWRNLDRAVDAPGKPLDMLQQKLGLSDGSAPAAALAQAYRVSEGLKARIAQVQDAFNAAVKAQDKAVISEARVLWERGEFRKALANVDSTLKMLQALPTVDPSGQEELKRWKGQLQVCCDRSEQLKTVLSAIQGQGHEISQAGVQGQVEQLAGALEALDRDQVDARAALPPALQEEARALAVTARSVLSPEGRPEGLPALSSPAWAPLSGEDITALLTERLATYLQRRAEAARDAGDYRASQGWLDRLERLQGKLPGDAADWWCAQAAHIDALKRIELLLERAKSHLDAIPPRCEEAHKLLVTAAGELNKLKLEHSQEADSLRRQATTLWVKVVQETAQPQAAQVYCRAARDLLQDPTLVGRLATLEPLLTEGVKAEAERVRLRQALGVSANRDAVAQRPGGEPPAGSELAPGDAAQGAEDDATAAALLAKLHERLTKLISTECWPTLREWAQKLQNETVQVLDGWLDARQSEVTAALGKDDKDYAAAVEAAGRVTGLGLAERWQLTLKEKLKTLADSEAQAKGIVDARAALDKLRDDLANGAAGADQVADLPQPPQPDTYCADGQALLELWWKLATLNQELMASGRDYDYAAAIDRRLTLSKAEVPNLPAEGDEGWEAWQQNVLAQRTRVQEDVVTLTGRLAEALAAEAADAPARAPLTVSTLLKLYWQARWTRAALHGDAAATDVVKALEEALAGAAGILPAVVKRLLLPQLDKLGHAEMEESLWAPVQELVVALQAWHAGLTTQSKDVQLPDSPVSDNYEPLMPANIKALNDLAAALTEGKGWRGLTAANNFVDSILGQQTGQPASAQPQTSPPAVTDMTLGKADMPPVESPLSSTPGAPEARQTSVGLSKEATAKARSKWPAWLQKFFKLNDGTSAPPSASSEGTVSSGDRDDGNK